MSVSPTFSNVRWGPNLTDVLDVALNSVRGDNPLLIYRHSGGGSAGYKGEIWGGIQPEMDALFTYLMDPAREVHYDIASVESDQVSFDPAFIPRGRIVHFPHIVTSYQRSILGARMVLAQYGTDVSRVELIGGSHGGWLNLMQMLMQPVFDGSGQRNERRTRYTTRGWNSRVKAAICWQLAYPDWRKRCTAEGLNFTGATAAAGPMTITLAGAFTNYRFSAGDQLVITTGATPGTYAIASKDNGNGFVTLTTSPGSGVCSGYVSTDQTDLSISHFLFGTKRLGTGPDGLPFHGEWDAMPLELKAAVSPLDWAEKNQLAYAIPTYIINHEEGDGIKPCGNTFTGGSSVHDWRAAQAMSDALRAKGKSSTFEKYANAADWSATTDIPARLYNWLVARLAE